MKHVVRISDGLGNQLFQYAFAYALHRETGAEVLIDPLFWGTSIRHYDLEKFNISIKKKLVSPAMDYLLGFGPRNGRRFKNVYRNIIIDKKYKRVNEELVMKYDDDMFHQNSNSFFEGFWQTYKYFDKYKNEIKKEFMPLWPLSEKAKEYLVKIEEKPSVAIHIRRTDYVRLNGNVALDLSYYSKAIEVISGLLKDYNVFAFSDDKDFVKRNLKINNYIMVEGVSDLDEFELLRRCNHKIIANSTFSWWAAYLGDNSDSIVIAPEVDMWTGDFYPPEWNIIKAQL